MERLYDVIIVGGGPAGLSAAIYMARAKYKVLVLEKEKFGGQITITSEVVNYPGVFHTSGTDLTSNMKKQAESFGAEFKIAEVLSVGTNEKIKKIVTNDGEYSALGIILAVGANPRKLGFEGELEYQGRGVAYCATCDGEFFKGMKVYVVGGGFAAVEEGIFLTKYAKEVEMIVREDDFTCAKTVSDHIYEHSEISVKFNTEVVRVSGDGILKSITLRNNMTNEEWEETIEDSFGVFVFAGYVPNTNWLPAEINKENGYIVTDINRKTNIDGIYAAGDVCIKNLRQVVTAVSDGAVAATSLEKCVEDLHKELNIPELSRNIAAKPVEPHNIESGHEPIRDSAEFISEEIRQQLQPIFERFQEKVMVKAYLGQGTLAEEMEAFLNECEGLNEKLICEKEKSSNEEVSYLEIFSHNGKSSGIKFRAIPGGHEFNSFITALYNVAGPGKEMPEMVAHRIQNINKEIDIKVLVSLSCTMCPEVVVSTQQIAAKSSMVNATMIDLMHAPDLKVQYKVMSVPCMIINDKDVIFGKKNIEEVLALLEKV